MANVASQPARVRATLIPKVDFFQCVSTHTAEEMAGGWPKCVGHICRHTLRTSWLRIRMPITHRSMLWFQEEFGLPIDEAVLRQLRALDWRALATDGWW